MTIRGGTGKIPPVELWYNRVNFSGAGICVFAVFLGVLDWIEWLNTGFSNLCP